MVTCRLGAPGAIDTIVNGFGLGANARVQEDPSGTLGGMVTGTITNTGPDAVPAGYSVEVTVQAMTLHAVVGGTAEFVPRDTIFECMKHGTALGPGQHTGMDFDFGAGGCPGLKLRGAPITILPCGLYRETMIVHGVDAAGRHFTTECKLYFFVPSSVRDINFVVTANPDNLPLTPPSPPGFVTVDPDDRFNFIAPLYPLAPAPFTGNAVQVVVTATPGQSLFILSGEGNDDPVSGSNTSFAPPLPLGQPNGIMGPAIVNYVLNVPNTGFNTAPCNDIGPPQSYEAKLDAVITAVSVEQKSGVTVFGCVIKQQTVKCSAFFECR